MNKELVSVIVPIYGVEKFLKTCVDSILEQTYSKLEVILVDDGSPDSCPVICDEYEKKDKRIRVIHKKNGGLSDARNYGLKVAKGDCIYFVDSDDYIHHDCIRLLYETMQKYKAEIVACNVRSVSPSSKKQYEIAISPKIEEMDSTEACLRLRTSDDYGIGSVVWNKLYRTKLFKNILFPEGMIHEDEAIDYQLVYPANKVVYIHDYLHYYRRSEKSIMRSDFSIKRFDILKALKMRNDFIKNKNEMLYQNNLIRYYHTLAYYQYLGKKYHLIDQQAIHEMKEEMNAVYQNIKHKNAKVILIKYFEFIYVRIYYFKSKLNEKLVKFKKGYYNEKNESDL